MPASVLLIDNYDSFTYNLVQAFLVLGAEVDVHRNDAITVPTALARAYTHLVISPGPGTPRDAGISMRMIEAFAGRLPILGVCLGHQSLVEVFGGRVVRAGRLMHGKVSEIVHDGRGVYAGLRQNFAAGRYHSLIADPASIPAQLQVTSHTPDGEIMGVRHTALHIEGVQFHPESVLTPDGPQLLGNFLKGGVSNHRQMLEQLLERRNMSEAQAAALLQLLTASELAPAMGGALLTALRAKGVTADEVRGFAGAMRSLARKPALPLGLDAIDIVGTGGDGSGSLNLSTGAALLAAACGLPVVKHGNRSISSRSGSADLIEALGFTLPLDENRAGECFVATGFTFLFAPYFHPAMKALAAIRSALGVRTVFNLLGPLMNPAAPRFLLAGAYDAATAELMAGTLAGMRIERAWVVHGAGGWDEATPIGSFIAFDVAGKEVTRREINPEQFGIARCTPRDLAGGDARRNLQALIDVFEGRDQGPHLDTLALQCGLALTISGRSQSIEGGIALARAVVDSGKAMAWLQRLRAFALHSAKPAVAG